MSWTTTNGRVRNTATGATATRNRVPATRRDGTPTGRKGREGTTGAAEEHRRLKRVQAELRNASTPPEKRRQFRLNAA